MDTQTLEIVKTGVRSLQDSNSDRLRKHKENLKKGREDGGLFDELIGKDAAYQNVLDLLDRLIEEG
jgi:hypothetical protein